MNFFGKCVYWTLSVVFAIIIGIYCGNKAYEQALIHKAACISALESARKYQHKQDVSNYIKAFNESYRQYRKYLSGPSRTGPSLYFYKRLGTSKKKN